MPLMGGSSTLFSARLHPDTSGIGALDPQTQKGETKPLSHVE